MKSILGDIGVIKIPLNPDVKPVKQRPYRLNPKYKEKVSVIIRSAPTNFSFWQHSNVKVTTQVSRAFWQHTAVDTWNRYKERKDLLLFYGEPLIHKRMQIME